jgi:DNA repair photolyase
MQKVLNYIARFLSMFIKTYSPKRVYVSKSALAYPRTQHIIRRIKKLNRKALIIYIPTNTPPRPNLKGKALYKYLKETIVICTRSAKYMEVFASPGRISENLGIMGKILFHCPLQCLFCYLDVSGRGTPWNRVYVDLEKFYDQAVKERFVYKVTLTLWSAISFHLKTPLNKVPEKFKEIVDHTIRKEILKKHSVITTDKQAVKYLKKHLREFFLKMDIQITHKQTAELKKAIPNYYAKNSQLPLSINISEYSDVLGLDHITNTLDELMQLIQKDPEFRIRFRTKAANIHNPLKYDGKNQVKITFGLNTEFVINKYEKGTASLEERIAAIKALMQRGGYEIDLAIEPIIKFKGYEDDYRDLIKKIKREIDLSQISKIKVGTVRYKTRLKNYIKNVHPTSSLITRNQQLCEPEPGDKRWRYSKEERLKIYQVIKDELISLPYVKLGLGSENPELWVDLGLDKGDIHSGVVYQYSEDENNNNS